jgi:23S rRNA (adenine2503-C2)-methyltransferase
MTSSGSTTPRKTSPSSCSDNGTAVAESVLYKYPDYATRTVICCSTQSGCPVGCRFCGAGDNFVRSLTADEIVAQVEHSIEQVGIQASEMKRLQIMFMSMGEPLLNLKGLIPALRELYASCIRTPRC